MVERAIVVEKRWRVQGVRAPGPGVGESEVEHRILTVVGHDVWIGGAMFPQSTIFGMQNGLCEFPVKKICRGGETDHRGFGFVAGVRT